MFLSYFHLLKKKIPDCCLRILPNFVIYVTDSRKKKESLNYFSTIKKNNKYIKIQEINMSVGNTFRLQMKFELEQRAT